MPAASAAPRTLTVISQACVPVLAVEAPPAPESVTVHKAVERGAHTFDVTAHGLLPCPTGAASLGIRIEGLQLPPLHEPQAALAGAVVVTASYGDQVVWASQPQPAAPVIAQCFREGTAALSLPVQQLDLAALHGVGGHLGTQLTWEASIVYPAGPAAGAGGAPADGLHVCHIGGMSAPLGCLLASASGSGVSGAAGGSRPFELRNADMVAALPTYSHSGRLSLYAGSLWAPTPLLPPAALALFTPPEAALSVGLKGDGLCHPSQQPGGAAAPCSAARLALYRLLPGGILQEAGCSAVAQTGRGAAEGSVGWSVFPVRLLTLCGGDMDAPIVVQAWGADGAAAAASDASAQPLERSAFAPAPGSGRGAATAPSSFSEGSLLGELRTSVHALLQASSDGHRMPLINRSLVGRAKGYTHSGCLSVYFASLLGVPAARAASRVVSLPGAPIVMQRSTGGASWVRLGDVALLPEGPGSSGTQDAAGDGLSASSSSTSLVPAPPSQPLATDAAGRLPHLPARALVRGKLHLTLQAANLAAKDAVVAGAQAASDPFFVLHRCGDARTRTQVYRSRVARRTLNCVWEPAEVDLAALCGGDVDAPLLLQVLDHDDGQAPDHIGEVATTLRQLLLVGSTFDLRNNRQTSASPAAGDSAGTLLVRQARLVDASVQLQQVEPMPGPTLTVASPRATALLALAASAEASSEASAVGPKVRGHQYAYAAAAAKANASLNGSSNDGPSDAANPSTADAADPVAASIIAANKAGAAAAVSAGSHISASPAVSRRLVSSRVPGRLLVASPSVMQQAAAAAGSIDGAATPFSSTASSAAGAVLGRSSSPEGSRRRAEDGSLAAQPTRNRQPAGRFPPEFAALVAAAPTHVHPLEQQVWSPSLARGGAGALPGSAAAGFPSGLLGPGVSPYSSGPAFDFSARASRLELGSAERPQQLSRQPRLAEAAWPSSVSSAAALAPAQSVPVRSGTAEVLVPAAGTPGGPTAQSSQELAAPAASSVVPAVSDKAPTTGVPSPKKASADKVQAADSHAPAPQDLASDKELKALLAAHAPDASSAADSNAALTAAAAAGLAIDRDASAVLLIL
jgi:hypothetical protein